MSTETLSPLDATFLELEDADASAHMHIGAILVFGPFPDGRPPSLQTLRESVAQRLPLLPRYRQRLSSARVGRVGWPSWEDMPDFDVARQVRQAGLPAPGGHAELMALAEEFFSQRLDRTGPLWELLLVDGLEDGRWALLSKTHHCLVDGVGSIDIAYLLFDTEPDGEPPDVPAPDRPEPESRHWWSPAGDVVGGAAGAVGGAAGLARHPKQVAGLVERAVAVADVLVQDELRGAPSTSLNDPIGGRRRLRELVVDLDDVKEIKNALGGTVNDVVLAGVTGGLRALFLSRGENPPPGLRAMVPVNQRREDEHGDMGNRITSLFVELPVEEPTRLRRYELVRENTVRLKASDQGLGSDTMIRLAGLSPPVLHSVIAQSLFGRRLFNVTVTNVPGPPMALYALGARLEAVHPLVPLAAEHAVGVAIMSYDGRLGFGVVTDHDSVPDIDFLSDGIAEELGALLRLAREGGG